MFQHIRNHNGERQHPRITQSDELILTCSLPRPFNRLKVTDRTARSSATLLLHFTSLPLPLA
jgi:hypothetical protein